MSGSQYSRERSRSPMNSAQRSQSPSDHSDVDRGTTPATLYIANIPKHWTHWNVKAFIKDKIESKWPSDEIKYVTIIKDKVTGLPTGGCLVKFRDAEQSKRALALLSGAMCEGKKIIVIEDVAGRLKDQLLDNKSAKLKKKERGMNDIETQSSVKNSSFKKDSNDEDNMTTYGLSLEFLQSLGITPPLSNRLFTVNLDFRVDEAKLKEVFGLAGTVLSVNLHRGKDGTSRGMAQIEYDHPVEAVQAISMFNSQKLYDRPIAVRFDRTDTKPLSLPTGLSSLGPGLGPKGTPLRAVRNFVELQPLKKLFNQLENTVTNSSNTGTDITHQQQQTQNAPVYNQAQVMTNTSIPNPLLLSNMNNPLNSMGINLMVPPTQMGMDMSQSNTETLNAWMPNNMSLNQPTAPMNVWNMNQSNTPAALTQMLTGGTVNNQSLQLLQALMQAQGGVNSNLAASLATFGNQTVSQNAMGFAQTQQIQPMNQTTARKPMGSFGTVTDNANRELSNQNMQKDNTQMDQRTMCTDMVIITNLPSSVTLSILRDKMREVGELRMAEMTSHDTAIVRFVNISEAQRCVKIFDRSRVDGQTIEVRCV